jgi:hypothetical protein
MALNVFKSDEDKARAEIQKLCALREKLHVERSRAEVELTSLRATLPESDLAKLLSDGENLAEAKGALSERERIRILETGLAATESALGALSGKLRQAHQALKAARSDALNRQADILATKRIALSKRVESAMRELEAISGAEYVPAALYQRAVLGAMSANGNTILPDLPAAHIPQPELMLAEEQALRQKAFDIQKAQVREHGEVQGESLEALLEALAGELKNELVIGPSEAAVRAYFTPERTAAARAAWNKSFESKIAGRQEGHTSEAPYVMRVILVWSAGSVTAASRVVYEATPSQWRAGPLRQREAGGAAYTT